MSFSLACELRGLAKLVAPVAARTMRAEVAQLDRLRAVLEG